MQSSPGFIDGKIWVQGLIKASFPEGVILTILKEVVMQPLLKNALVDITDLNNYHSMVDIPLGSKLLEWMVATQLQVFLENDYLHPFQSEFKRLRIEADLVSPNTHCPWKSDRGGEHFC